LRESWAKACAVAVVEGEAILVSPSFSGAVHSAARRGVSAHGESTVSVIAGVDRPAEPVWLVFGVMAARGLSGVLREKKVGLRGVRGSGSTSRPPKPWIRVVVVVVAPDEIELTSDGGRDGRFGMSSSSTLDVIELGGETVKLEMGELGSLITSASVPVPS
jgi:hypothetical protein